MTGRFELLDRLAEVLHEDDSLSLAEKVIRGDLDGRDERAMLDAAIDLHAERYGVTLNFTF